MKKLKILVILLSSILFACSVSTSGGGNDYTEEEEAATISYTVNFYDNNSNLLESQVIPLGNKVKRPANPEGDENSRFVGWYENPNFTKRFIFNSPITENKNLYVRFINNNYIPTGEEFTIEAPIPGSNIFIEDENGARNITIPSLYVCDHEVTQDEWAKYMKPNN